MPETERERVDQCISEAKEEFNNLASGENKRLAKIAVSCTEAIVRQLRDLDDDIWRLGDVTKESIADLSVVINGN